MKKLTGFILSGAMVFGLGATMIFGNGVLAAQAIDVSVGGEIGSVTSVENTSVSQDNKQLEEQVFEDGSKIVIRRTEDGQILSCVFMNPNGEIDESIIPVIAGTPEHEAMEKQLLSDRENQNLPEYVEGQPKEGDITEEEARDIAFDELIGKYALKDELLDRFSVTAVYYSIYDDITAPVWWVNLYPKNTNEFSEIGCFTAIINAETGNAVQLLSAVDGKG